MSVFSLGYPYWDTWTVFQFEAVAFILLKKLHRSLSITYRGGINPPFLYLFKGAVLEQKKLWRSSVLFFWGRKLHYFYETVNFRHLWPQELHLFIFHNQFLASFNTTFEIHINDGTTIASKIRYCKSW